VTLDLTGIDLTTETVRGDRLLLRPHRPGDVDGVYRACQDPDLQRWLTALPVPYRREDAAVYITEISARGRANGTDLGCAIEVDGELVGSCGLHSLTSGRLGPEIGYWIAPGARREGSAAEAARALADWALAHGAERVHLFTDVANTPSQAVARRAGFTQEGVVRRCLTYRDGSRADALLFGRLAGE
jgi:RimJ/RimL family protein N-acetyltransferase